jgi:ribosomal protein L37AE/L43A
MLPPWEIKKKECVEHYPLQRLINGSWECRACGKKLKPKWEAINE